ncbi:Diaminopimelate epimerase-like protein [Hypoxylon fuscum]|nr:Diaminopimelate epimerase-like protein [Hypoxylon fuscum]
MDLQFVTLDVFSSTRLQGNPLAVVSVPAALKSKLSQATKQKIAQEFNLSETVFLHEAADQTALERHADIFTVEREITFGGHPTVGTAFFLVKHLQAPVETLVIKAGPIGLFLQDDNQIRAKIPHNVHLHAKTLADVVGSADYPGFSPVPQIRDAELRAPVFSVVKGMTFVLVKLPSLDLLGQVSVLGRLDFDGLPRPLLDEEWRDSFVCRYYYVDMGEEGGQRCLRTRMVELGFEDPATGSAASALGSYLTLMEEKKGTKFKLTQGVEMGRRSDISVETATKTNNGVELVDLWLGGTAVVIMKGSLTVDV